MAFNVTDFRAALVGDGARPNLFMVTLAFPAIAGAAGSTAGSKVSFMAKSSQLPGSTVGVVPMYYFGRELKFAGNRSFSDWTLQIVNDEDFTIRNAMETWSNAINSHLTNVRNPSALNNFQYTVDATVTQFGKTGNTLKTYNMVGLFPTDIAPIDLDWGSNDSIEEYAVTFSYQYWESNTTT